MRKAIIILLIICLFVACIVNEQQKYFYDTNKFILLAALLEDYHQKEGFYPTTLQEVKKNYYDFLETHPDLKRNYFLESWSYRETKVPFLSTASGRNIQYFISFDRKEYYLWDGMKNEELTMNLATLQDIRDGKIFLWYHVAFIYNGKPIRLYAAHKTDKITLDNMESLFFTTKRPIIPMLTW